MEKPTIDWEQAQNFIREILLEIENIKRASEAYHAMIHREYGESNLHFLKELSNMFGADEKHNGIGAQAANIAAICRQAEEALEEYFEETEGS